MAHRVYLADAMPSVLAPVVEAFGQESGRLAHDDVRRVTEVRAQVAPHLKAYGWVVAEGGRREFGIPIATDSAQVVRADAAHRDHRAALWIETGRSWTNNGFLEHLVEAIPCPDVMHLCIAVRTLYNGQAAFEKVVRFLDPVMATDRVDFPFRSLVVIGY
jgi:hypothetical protein